MQHATRMPERSKHGSLTVLASRLLVGEGGSARSAETDEGFCNTPHPTSPSARPPSPKGGEGKLALAPWLQTSIPHISNDRVADGIHLAQQVVVPEALHAKAAQFKFHIALPVIVRICMLAAVDFDDQQGSAKGNRQ